MIYQRINICTNSLEKWLCASVDFMTRNYSNILHIIMFKTIEILGIKSTNFACLDLNDFVWVILTEQIIK